MKIYFAFQNTDTIDKLSPSLQAKDINMLKAEPSKIPMRGLYRIEQPGYTEYSSNIPAFIYATMKGSRVPLGREGYPILTPVDKVLPLAVPRIFVSYKGREIPKIIKDFTDVKELPAKDKTRKQYTLEYKAGLLGILEQSNYEKGMFPIANTIAAEELVDMITILRIISGFLHTHKYPAFDDEDEFTHEFEAQFETEKRALTLDEYTPSILEDAKRRMVSVKVGGESTWVKPSTLTGNSVVLRHAKPQNLEPLAWGQTSDVPVTDGIVFPFEMDLCVWDKMTVCNLLSSHFIRCLGHTTDGCLQRYSQLCVSWKRSLYRTSLGNVLSHLARVIELAIPAQARAFPVFESGRYTGCYLSGAGFSIGLQKEVIRPVSFESNSDDMSTFEGNDAVLDSIMRVYGVDLVSEPGRAKMKTVGGYQSMRGLQRWLDTRVSRPDTIEKARLLASRLSYPQDYLRINMENIRLVLSWVKGDKPIPKDAPMHSHGLGRISLFELALSAFGPTAPSPVIPGAQKIQLTSKPPDKFNKTLAFRTTHLETAISDWKEVGDTGYTYNGPERLSARFQYVALKGEDERKAWFETMHGFHMWSKSKLSGMESSVVAGDDDGISGGVSLGERSIQFDGF